jgi:hypothetical protein
MANVSQNSMCYEQNKIKHSSKKFIEADIIKMLEFLIDKMVAIFRACVFQYAVSIPMDTNCVPLLVDFSHYSYAADFIKGLPKKRT